MLTISFPETLKQAIYARGNKPVERLKGLVEILSEWSKVPSTRQEIISFAENLTPVDVNAIKQLISQEINRIDFRKKEEVTEQLLFNIVGALKNSQNETLEDPWRIAKLNVNFLLSNSKKRLSRLYLVYASVIIAAGSLIGYANQKGLMVENKKPEGLAMSNVLVTMPPPMPNPYIPSHFYSLRAKMSKANCQFPQAAVLPQEQRAAFLAFINTGEITLSQLSNLQDALTHVNCQYTPLTASLSRTEQ